MPDRRIPFEHAEQHAVLGEGARRALVHSDFQHRPQRPVSSCHRAQGRTADRRRARTIAGACARRSGRACQFRRPPAATSGEFRRGGRARFRRRRFHEADRRLRFQYHSAQRFQGVPAARRHARIARRRKIRTGLEAKPARQRQARRRQHAGLRRNGRPRDYISKASGTRTRFSRSPRSPRRCASASVWIRRRFSNW